MYVGLIHYDPIPSSFLTLTIPPLHPPFPPLTSHAPPSIQSRINDFWPPAGKPRPRRVKQRPRPSFITSVVVRRRGAALSFLSRVFGRRQANTAPDAYSSGFRAHPSNLWLLPSSPPRSAAALSRRHDVSPSRKRDFK
ncbi:hypothetical protein R3P38DRAFT_3172139 [Favolaschia claudopus]|uniref:Uncharacterized protein n=1 Tax=Favolaschia claudopus TaxID=2862362 RepID=A0AAW0DIS2_9AGAR